MVHGSAVAAARTAGMVVVKGREVPLPGHEDCLGRVTEECAMCVWGGGAGSEQGGDEYEFRYRNWKWVWVIDV